MIVNFVPNIVSGEFQQYGFPEANTISEVVEMLGKEHDLESVPFIARVNGIPVLRKDWGFPQYGAVEIVCVPGVATLLVASIVVTLASLAVTAYLYLTTKVPTIASSSLPTAKDVFSFSGRENAQKLNQPIEISYGRNRWYPPFYTLPRIRFDSKNQVYMDIWLSLGIGDIDISEVKVGDTLVETLSQCSYRTYSPGTIMDSEDPFDMVFIGDKTNVELAGPNEDSFESIQTILNPANAPIQMIQVNFGMTSGLYNVSGSTLTDATVVAKIRFRGVDSSGNPTTAWSSPSPEVTITAHTNTPLRYSYSFEPTFSADRYEISVERVNNASTATSGCDKLSMISAYGLGRNSSPSAVNLMLVTLKGTNAIEEDSASKINCVTTRKLKTLTAADSVWTDPVPTRNPIWAILDVLTSKYGAMISRDKLDKAYWWDLAKQTDSNFDTVFSNKTTVWDILKAICETLKGEPVCVGSDVRIARDRPDLIPICQFTPDNASNLNWISTFKQTLEEDCVEAVYVDPVSGLQSSVQFTPLGSQMINPKTITFTGVTDRDQAWRLAAYAWQQMTLCRDRVTFDTGMDGMIPLYGDVVNIAWPFPAWACAGVVLGYDGALTLQVSEELPVVPLGSAWMTLRAKDGSVFGPVRCSGTGDLITLSQAVPAGMFDFDGFTSEPVMFTYGTSDNLSKNFRVTSVAPSGNTVSIEATEYDSASFIYDTFNAPAYGQDRIPYQATPGMVPWVRVIPDGTFLRIVFPQVLGGVYSVAYAYDPITGDIKDPDSAPWAITPVDVFGTVAYVPRNVGNLFILITCTISGTTYKTYYRSHIAATDSGSYPIMLRVDNSEPALASNVAHIALGDSIGTINLPYNATSIVVKINRSISGGTQITLTNAASSTVRGTTDDFGNYTFTLEALITAGLVGITGPNRIDAAWMSANLTQTIPPDPQSIEITSTVVWGEYTLPEAWMGVDWARGYIKKYVVSLITTAIGEYGSEWGFVGECLSGPVVAVIEKVERSRQTTILAHDCACVATPTFTGTNSGGMSPDAQMHIGHRLLSDASQAVLDTNSFQNRHFAAVFLDQYGVLIPGVFAIRNIYTGSTPNPLLFSVKVTSAPSTTLSGIASGLGDISYNQLLTLQSTAKKIVVFGASGYSQQITISSRSINLLGGVSGSQSLAVSTSD